MVKMGNHRAMFAASETLNAFCEKIILPNMAIRGEWPFVERAYITLDLEHEEEMFEDDPLEYIRRDLEPSTGTRHARNPCTHTDSVIRKRHPTTGCH